MKCSFFSCCLHWVNHVITEKSRQQPMKTIYNLLCEWSEKHFILAQKGISVLKRQHANTHSELKVDEAMKQWSIHNHKTLNRLWILIYFLFVLFFVFFFSYCAYRLYRCLDARHSLFLLLLVLLLAHTIIYIHLEAHGDGKNAVFLTFLHRFSCRSNHSRKSKRKEKPKGTSIN